MAIEDGTTAEVSEEIEVLKEKGAVEGPVAPVAPVDAKEALYRAHPTSYSVCMIIGILLNLALLLFSHLGVSAFINSTICPASFDGCIAPPTNNLDSVDRCSNNTDDLALLQPGEPAFDDFAAYLKLFGTQCLFPPADIPSPFTCLEYKVNQQYGLSYECTTCFEAQYQCSKQFCIQFCAINPDGLDCQQCSQDNCIPAFEECSGIDIATDSPSPDLHLRILQDDDDEYFDAESGCLSREGVVLYDVFDLTFFNSVTKAWTGGARPLAVLVIAASFVWPYAKNLLMLLAWFAPLRSRQREPVLRALAILGKWSLVDVFAVVLIMVGVRIDKLFSEGEEDEPYQPLIVFAESRHAIYAFGIAAIWALLQGELIRYLARSSRIDAATTKKKEEMKMKDELEILRLRLALGTTAALALIAGAAGVFLVALEFTTSGLITTRRGPNSLSYTTIGVATALLNSCGIYPGMETVAGTYFLAVLFVLMCVVVPLVTYLSLVVLAMRMKGRSRMVGAVLGLSNFAAMDVYVLSLLTLSAQFEGLIDSAIGSSIDEECGITEESPEDQFCIKFVGRLEIGAWVLLVSVVCFWAAQVCAASLLQKLERSAGGEEGSG